MKRRLLALEFGTAGYGLRAVFLAGLLLYAAALAAAPRSLLILGDSLSAGYGLEAGTGWVELLEQRITEQGLPWEVVNASISGETTAGGLARLPRLLEQHRPGVVVIELGGNDGLRALPVDEIRANLEAMVQLAREQRARVLLVGMRIPPNYGPGYTRRFQQAYVEVADEFDVRLVPFLLEGVATTPGMMQADGIHAAPGAQGRLLDNVWPDLEELLE